MSQAINWISSISLNDPAVWLLLLAGLGIVLLLLARQRHHDRASVPIAAKTEAEEIDLNPADAWLPPTKAPDERRQSTRRAGVPTAVQICDPKKPQKLIGGYVLDRSRGGLRLAMEKPIATGVVLNVRPADAPPEVAWTPIFVRSCNEVGDYFEVGGEFQVELSWNLLLMFG
jgi:hypothetical protein